ncbi:MAG: GNAT family N-acetyltransferase [Bacteroidales bacterium]|jgi:putative acetyltransferase|nr:GNAT family N-acetyltransferase [Bacteroidales bacterium]
MTMELPKTKKDCVIQPYNDSYKEQIIAVWEKSVCATHTFLAYSDITYYKKIISDMDFNAIQTFCLMNKNTILGFIGVVGRKIEMLFLYPDIMKQGYGKMLVQYAVEKLKASMVDVNEQNLGALEFYRKCGFVVYERTDKDDEGKDYPILKMQLDTQNITRLK